MQLINANSDEYVALHDILILGNPMILGPADSVP